MSLINEALKRARDASYQDGPPDHSVPAYQDALSAPIVVPTSRGTSPMLFVFAAILIVAGGVFAWILMERMSSPKMVALTVPAPVPVTATVASEPIPSDVTVMEPAAPVTYPVATVEPVKPTEPAISEDALVARIMERLKDEAATGTVPDKQPSANPSESVPVVAVAPEVRKEPPPPPALGLQAVMVHGTSRQAIINGRGVQVGDTVDGAEVIRIEQRTVVVRWRDEEITLRMP